MVDFLSRLVGEAVIHVLGREFDSGFERIELLFLLSIRRALVAARLVFG